MRKREEVTLFDWNRKTTKDSFPEILTESKIMKAFTDRRGLRKFGEERPETSCGGENL